MTTNGTAEGAGAGAGPIDKAVFEELLASVAGDMAFLGDLIDTFQTDSSDQLAQLHRSLAAGDVETFRRAAHSLKSNSASFGAAGLAAQARDLEMMARAGSLEGAAEKVAGVEAALRHVSAELGRLRTAA